jgi:hypothetical protein
MAETSQGQQRRKKFQLTTDGWAVAAALALALLVRVGVIHRVPW